MPHAKFKLERLHSILTGATVAYSAKFGRFTIKNFEDNQGETILTINEGRNEYCAVRRFNLNIEELRDLQYLLERAIINHPERGV